MSAWPSTNWMVRMSTPSASRRQAPSWRRSCQCRSIWRSLARSTLAPGFARFVSWPLASSSNDSQAVLKLVMNSPEDEPNTKAFGPSAARRLRIGASRPCGSKGNATILRILRVRPGNGDLLLLPVHASVLDPQHLALTTTRFEYAHDAIVHR